jgi:hypothetical protein
MGELAGVYGCQQDSRITEQEQLPSLTRCCDVVCLNYVLFIMLETPSLHRCIMSIPSVFMVHAVLQTIFSLSSSEGKVLRGYTAVLV